MLGAIFDLNALDLVWSRLPLGQNVKRSQVTCTLGSFALLHLATPPKSILADTFQRHLLHLDFAPGLVANTASHLIVLFFRPRNTLPDRIQDEPRVVSCLNVCLQ
jgi:hypothetical protein